MDAASDSDTDNTRKALYHSRNISIAWTALRRICTGFFAAARTRHGLRRMRC